MDRFLDLMNTVKKKNNSHFHSCEPELIELMRQIDEMIELKKEEWRGSMESLEAKLHEAHNENRILIKEIQLLKTGLKDEKKSHACTLTQYEKDVRLLKDDMARLKKKYIELQKKIEYTKKKNANISKPTNEAQRGDTYKNNNDTSCEIYQNEKLILKLKLESLALENGNLRALIQEQSKQLTEKIDYSELSVPEDPPYQENDIPEMLEVTKGNGFDASPVPSRDRKDRLVRDGPSTIPETPPLLTNPQNNDGQSQQMGDSMLKYHFGGNSHVMDMEYFDPDHSLEDKLNKIIAQFESVSSSMLLQ